MSRDFFFFIQLDLFFSVYELKYALMVVFVLLTVDPHIDIYLTDLLLRRCKVKSGSNVEIHVRCLWINELFDEFESWVVLKSLFIDFVI